MQGGITGQPVQQMAGGGIIAFDEGGSIPRNRSIVPYKAPFYKRAGSAALNLARRHPLGLGLGALLGVGLLGGEDEEQAVPEGVQIEQLSDGLSDEDIRLLAGVDAERPAAGAASQATALPAAPKFKRPDLSAFTEAIDEAKKRVPKSEQEAVDAEMKMLKEAGAFEGIEARRKQLAGQKEKATTSPEKKFWLAFAQAGFAASNKGARNLWETLSMGGVEGMKAYEAMKEKEQETLEKIADRQFQLDEMLSNKKLTATQAGRKRFDDARKDLQGLQLQHAAQQASITNAENTFGANIYGTQAQVAAADRRFATSQAGRKGKDNLIQQYYADIAAAQRTTDPKLKAALERRAKNTEEAIARIERTESGYQSQAARLDARNALLNRGMGDDGFGDIQVE